MADIQRHIEEFDVFIRLKKFDENATLREKRDIVLNKLRERLAARRKAGEQIPTFDPFNQGSYQMGTGIQPAKGDFDIDVGLRFNCTPADYENPVDLKLFVADALEGHTELGTDMRRSCVTVNYMQDGEKVYHVDLAVYACDDPTAKVPSLQLAKGKRNSDERSRWWEPSDPQGLMSWVGGRFSDEDKQVQFLRVIRLFKRWRSEKFSTDGSNAPAGIGLTVAAGNWFEPQVTHDPVPKSTTSDDLRAMRTLVARMVSGFVSVGLREDGSSLYRLTALLPVAPRKDIFEKMTDAQMTVFRERLIQLAARLEEVTKEPDPVEACKIMQREFGKEFPVPEKVETAQTRGRAITSGGVSA